MMAQRKADNLKPDQLKKDENKSQVGLSSSVFMSVLGQCVEQPSTLARPNLNKLR